jgi:hypothetical protein
MSATKKPETLSIQLSFEQGRVQGAIGKSSITDKCSDEAPFCGGTAQGSDWSGCATRDAAMIRFRSARLLRGRIRATRHSFIFAGAEIQCVVCSVKAGDARLRFLVSWAGRAGRVPTWRTQRQGSRDLRATVRLRGRPLVAPSVEQAFRLDGHWLPAPEVSAASVWKRC